MKAVPSLVVDGRIVLVGRPGPSELESIAGMLTN